MSDDEHDHRGADLWSPPPWRALLAGPQTRLDALDRAATPGWSGTKDDARDRLRELGEELSDLQERLWANGKDGEGPSVLLVVQGLDTAGKGGILRHVVGMVDPQGVALRAFGRPTEEERAHHYLWRIRNALPGPGRIGVFDRSHYEDVLVVRVEALVPPEVWAARYDEIVAFEQEVAARGTVLLKVALLISHEEQGARLLERLDRPDKHWKYNPGDIGTRLRWDDYQAAYQDLLDRTSTPAAPWFAIPADHKWYARLAVAELLTHTLRGLDLRWPTATFDVAAERARLAATMTAPERRSVLARDEDRPPAQGAGTTR